MKGPIGRIGRPIDRRRYEKYWVSDVRLYVEARLLEALEPEETFLTIYMGDYGTWRIHVLRSP